MANVRKNPVSSKRNCLGVHNPRYGPGESSAQGALSSSNSDRPGRAERGGDLTAGDAKTSGQRPTTSRTASVHIRSSLCLSPSLSLSLSITTAVKPLLRAVLSGDSVVADSARISPLPLSSRHRLNVTVGNEIESSVLDY
ncbi:hypothetical protein J6590_042944 [Homalodisca vitripennis]|nr:hypothetical protein J6590_042944 [Homalodisca vitripennis]